MTYIKWFITSTWFITLTLIIFSQALVTASLCPQKSNAINWFGSFWGRLYTETLLQIRGLVASAAIFSLMSVPILQKVSGGFLCSPRCSVDAPLFSLFFLHSVLFWITALRGRSKHCALVIKANFHHSFSPPVSSVPQLGRKLILMGSGWLVQVK